MYSSDSNVESIGQLIAELRRYATLQGEYLRGSMTEVLVRLATLVVLFGFVFTLLLAVSLFFSFALLAALEPEVGRVAAFCIVAAGYALLAILLVLLRRPLIEGPLVRIMAQMIFHINGKKTHG